MCGIAGFIEYRGNKLSKGNAYKSLLSMTDCLTNRGPDDYGMSLYGYEIQSYGDKIYSKASDYKLALGHRRLSILDLSEKGRQPMSISNGTFEIIFNGEIYNYIELRDELGDAFQSNTDTEVILRGYEKWGKNLFAKLDGMYSFALLDKSKNILLCARDPMGIKPFYYSSSESHFIFASEPRAILKVLGINGTPDINRTAEFLMMGITDHDEGTFFQEVKQLQGGHYMEVPLFRNENNPVKFWFPPSVLFDETDFTDITYDNLRLSVSRQLRSDVKVGTSLSGGIDSGTIVTIAGELLKNNNQNYNTYTFTSSQFKDDEIEMARLIAKNSKMNLVPVEPEVNSISDDLKNMIINMGEPFSTLSMFAQYKVMQAASLNDTKVMLDGQGGDELYLGYPRLAQRIIVDYLKKIKLVSFFGEWLGLKRNASLPLWRSLAGNLIFRSPFFYLNRSRSKLIDFVNPDLLSQYRISIAEDIYSNKTIEQTQLDELTKYCLPRLLRYEDRNSMAFSVESRVPHLSQVMIDFALMLPLNWRVRNGWTKYSVRKAMNGKLPDEVLWSKKKQGFSVPQKYWVEKLRPQLGEWITGNEKFFNTDKILKKIDSGGGNDPHLWRIISTASWINLLNLRI